MVTNWRDIYDRAMNSKITDGELAALDTSSIRLGTQKLNNDMTDMIYAARRRISRAKRIAAQGT